MEIPLESHSDALIHKSQIKKTQKNLNQNNNQNQNENNPKLQKTSNKMAKRRKSSSLFFCCIEPNQMKTKKKKKKNRKKQKRMKQKLCQEKEQKLKRNSLSKCILSLTENSTTHLLPNQSTEDHGKKTLILDLDETLVHSSLDPISNPDYVLEVTVDSETYKVYVKKRPGVEEFLSSVGLNFEIIIFTASDTQYANAVIERFENKEVIKGRLFRDSCTQHESFYVKDLSLLGRDLKTTIIIDNSPMSYMWNKENSLPISTWINDPNDTELFKLSTLLQEIAHSDDTLKALSLLRK
ncbi:ctd small phosphatase-like protein [Anaeramoeba ignava]|uniref:Ctd small phosphatase-like protein n=1 Tax=Anaeramoeba ignava TaxID=1746090 RepID=A0A9Q0RE02_ANAIG|nr:ctd small phosphatase-like protein [Anaeramoeba ignava]